MIDVIPGLTSDQLSLRLLWVLKLISTSHQQTANQREREPATAPAWLTIMLFQHDGAFISFERIIFVC